MNTEHICIKCGTYYPHPARGLCKACYSYHKNRDQLEQYPRITWKSEDLLAELGFWRERGLSVQQAAERIGVKPSTARQALLRARGRGCQ